MPQRRKPTLTPEEARKFHHEALVIDAQHPPATSGLLFTQRMRGGTRCGKESNFRTGNS